MSDSQTKLIASLMAARAAIDSLLLEVTEEVQAVAPATSLPGDGTSTAVPCNHATRQSAMGGHWWCPTCGATG